MIAGVVRKTYIEPKIVTYLEINMDLDSSDYIIVIFYFFFLHCAVHTLDIICLFVLLF